MHHIATFDLIAYMVLVALGGGSVGYALGFSAGREVESDLITDEFERVEGRMLND